jgi:hypothetical protein
VTKTVELHQAFLWTCDECGFDQFERSVPYDGPPLCVDCHHPEAEHRLATPDCTWRLCDRAGCSCDDFTLPDPADVFLVAPARVQCSLCGARFETTGQGAYRHGADD